MTDDLQSISQKIDTLTTRIDDLEKRLDSIEGAETPTEGAVDRYDGYVISELERGETVALGRLKALYRQSGIRQRSTLKRRVKQLMHMPYFERVGTQQWRFVGWEEGRKNE